MSGFDEWGNEYPALEDDCTTCEHPKTRHAFDDQTLGPDDGAWCTNELLAAIESVTRAECWPPHIKGAACERCYLRRALANYRAALNARGTKR